MNNDEISGYISIDKLKSGYNRIIIYGAGNDGIRLYKKLVTSVDISFFIDNGAFWVRLYMEFKY